jgi:hypothetical protein
MTDAKRGTYDIIRKAIDRDLMRDLGNSEIPLSLGAVRSCALPLQDDLTVINRDQPASRTNQPRCQCSSSLGESEKCVLAIGPDGSLDAFNAKKCRRRRC